MNALEIVAIVIVVVLLALALGGAVANRRRSRDTAGAFHERVSRANEDLASAHASDNGWDPRVVEAAAREAFAARRPGEEVSRLALVRVVDPPGTDDDKAVFRVMTASGAHDLTLGRVQGQWVLEDLQSG